MVKRPVLTYIFIIFTLTASGQVSFPDLVEKAYGIDQALVNGIQNYDRYRDCSGHPYFLDGLFRKGSLTIRGRLYRDVNLKYNLHSQQVELEYETFSGGSNQIILVPEHLDIFTLGPHDFQKRSFDGFPSGFYQVIQTGSFNCYIFRDKELIPLNNSTLFTAKFTQPRSLYLLEMSGMIHAFKNIRTFAGLFPEELQRTIRKDLRRGNFSFRRPEPDVLERKLISVSNLLKTGSGSS